MMNKPTSLIAIATAVAVSIAIGSISPRTQAQTGRIPSAQTPTGQNSGSGSSSTGTQTNPAQNPAGSSNIDQMNNGSSNAGQPSTNPSDTNRSNTDQFNNVNEGQSNPGRANSGQTNTGQSSTGQSSDASFMTDAAQSGIAEVSLAKLAQQKSSDKRVKEFARRIERDHEKANNALMQIFRHKKMTPPTATDSTHQSDVDRLSKLSGAEFDREYMSLMVREHQKDIADFQREAKSAKDRQLRAWTQQTLPKLEQHLKSAQSIDRSLTASSGKGSGSRGQQ